MPQMLLPSPAARSVQLLSTAIACGGASVARRRKRNRRRAPRTPRRCPRAGPGRIELQLWTADARRHVGRHAHAQQFPGLVQVVKRRPSALQRACTPPSGDTCQRSPVGGKGDRYTSARPVRELWYDTSRPSGETNPRRSLAGRSRWVRFAGAVHRLGQQPNPPAISGGQPAASGHRARTHPDRGFVDQLLGGARNGDWRINTLVSR